MLDIMGGVACPTAKLCIYESMTFRHAAGTYLESQLADAPSAVP